MSYRLHIDIPLMVTEEQAIQLTHKLIRMLDIPTVMNDLGVEEICYRLGHDDDRQKSNYLDKNTNGHVSSKKIKISYMDLTESK